MNEREEKERERKREWQSVIKSGEKHPLVEAAVINPEEDSTQEYQRGNGERQGEARRRIRRRAIAPE